MLIALASRFWKIAEILLNFNGSERPGVHEGRLDSILLGSWEHRGVPDASFLVSQVNEFHNCPKNNHMLHVHSVGMKVFKSA